MGNGRGVLVLQPPQLAKEQVTFFKEEPAEEGRLEGLRWVDRKLATKELGDIKKRMEELERERKIVAESLKKISDSNLPKASSDFYVVRRNVEKSVDNARRLWIALAGVEAAGALAAALSSGGLLIAGAAGTLGILGGALGSRSLSSNVDAEIQRIGKGVQLVEVRERLKDELNDFERENRRLQRRREELFKVTGELREVPISEHISRVRMIMDNLELMNHVQLAFLKKWKRRNPIPAGKLREIHDSVQELAYISCRGDEADKSLLARNIAREMCADILMRMEGVSDMCGLSRAGLDQIGRATSVLEKQLSQLKYVPPLYFE